MWIYPYRTGSKSVAALKEALQIKSIKRENSSFKGSEDKIVINWGNSMLPDEVLKCQIINKPDAVALACNKLDFFNKMKDKLSIPDFTIDKCVARSWIEAGKTVLARTKLTANSGQGIYILDSETSWNNFNHNTVKMYVKYVPKKDEYRVHISEGEVIDVQRKAKRADISHEVDWRIRNSGNGFVFVRQDVNPPKELLEECVKAVTLCGLDFGAVDVIWNDYYKTPYVLEINTAPGLEGSTINTYESAMKKKKAAFKKHIIDLEAVHELFPVPYADSPSTDSAF